MKSHITTYSNAREHLAAYLKAATDDRETVIIRRKKGEDVAMIAADELRSLEETAHLFRSPKNAKRLLAAMERAERGAGERLTLEQLRKKVGM